MRALGIALALATCALFPQVLKFFERSALIVQVDADEVSPGPYFVLDGEDLHNDTLGSLQIDTPGTTLSDELAPGLHYGSWTQKYRGGKTRSVGHAQLIGPFQDPQAPPCSTHLLIDQSFLDDGSKGKAPSEHTLAHIVRTQIAGELQSIDMWPLGAFQSMGRLSLQWTRWGDKGEHKPWQQRLRIANPESTPQGHLAIDFTAKFQKGEVPLHLKMTPIIESQSLRFEITVRAKLDLDNRLYQWVADLFDGNDRASKLIKSQIRSELRSLLDKPPPIPLGNGAFLPLEFCQGRQIIFSEQGYAAVPLAIGLGQKLPSPPLLKSTERPTSLPMDSGLAVEIDENGLNAILHALWASSILDTHLGDSLVRSFNEQETVQNFLSLRLREAFFHLPPTITLADEFHLRAAASVVIEDGESKNDARLFTQISFGLDVLQPSEQGDSPKLSLRQIELTCLESKARLASCYAGLMGQVRANQAPLQDLLTTSFSRLLTNLLTKREFSDSSTPGRYLLDHVRFRSAEGRIRAQLFGHAEAN